MKIALCSDIHLEFGPIELSNDQNADVLILSGDICLASEVNDYDVYNIMGENTKSARFHKFFQECSARFPHVIYVAGNHEHYHGDFATSLSRLKDKLGYLANLHILDKESVILQDTLFIGGTLWTDMNKEDPITLSHIRGVMNDYKIIGDSRTMVNYKAYIPKDKPVGVTDHQWFNETPYEDRHIVQFKQRPSHFSPEASVEDHKAMMETIKRTLESTTHEKVVVVGHHAPCKASVKPRYQGEHIINGAYSSDLSEFILDNPRIKLWTHGHTHDVFDYMIGSTRIACNPRGYIGYEDCADRFELMYIDV